MPRFDVGDVVYSRVSEYRYLILRCDTASYTVIREHDKQSLTYTHKNLDHWCDRVSSQPVKPKKVSCVRYFNVYPSCISESYSSRKEADDEADEERVSCYRVEFNEGEFHD